MGKRGERFNGHHIFLFNDRDHDEMYNAVQLKRSRRSVGVVAVDGSMTRYPVMVYPFIRNWPIIWISSIIMLHRPQAAERKSEQWASCIPTHSSPPPQPLDCSWLRSRKSFDPNCFLISVSIYKSILIITIWSTLFLPEIRSRQHCSSAQPNTSLTLCIAWSLLKPSSPTIVFTAAVTENRQDAVQFDNDRFVLVAFA